MTDDASDGRPWPIDPIRAWSPDMPVPVPELAGDEVSRVLAEFTATSDGSAHEGPPEPVTGADPVSDDDRTRFGLLLDRAAERGLVSPHEYQMRLGELATATSIEQMRKIVTELPAFTSSTAATGTTRFRRSAPATTVTAGAAPGTMLATATGRRRTSPWLLLGIVLLVLVASLVFFSIYAEHLVRNHGLGMPVRTVAMSPLNGLRP